MYNIIPLHAWDSSVTSIWFSSYIHENCTEPCNYIHLLKILCTIYIVWYKALHKKMLYIVQMPFYCYWAHKSLKIFLNYWSNIKLFPIWFNHSVGSSVVDEFPLYWLKSIGGGFIIIITKPWMILADRLWFRNITLHSRKSFNGSLCRLVEITLIGVY